MKFKTIQTFDTTYCYFFLRTGVDKIRPVVGKFWFATKSLKLKHH